MNWVTTQETIEDAVYRLDKEIAKVTGEAVGSYIDWLEDHAESYKYDYDPLEPDYEEWVINDLENAADRFIDFWTDNNKED